jgi:hypothetical protein
VHVANLTAPQDRCCDDVAFHCHDGREYKNGRPYAYRHAFRPRWPRATIYRAAERRRFTIRLNRYPGVVIGFAVQLGARVLSIVWGRPGRVIEIPATH